jgi:hypothetical protein
MRFLDLQGVGSEDFIVLVEVIADEQDEGVLPVVLVKHVVGGVQKGHLEALFFEGLVQFFGLNFKF